jgi:plasmid segregation protein ParM
MRKNIFAIDDGYGDLKLSNGLNTLIIPSQYSSYKPRPKNEFGENMVNANDFISVEIDRMKYVVGKGAEEINSNLKLVSGNNKHIDLGFPIILKTALSLLSSEENTKIDKLVMGLPVRAYKDEQRHNMLKQIVKQKHEVKMELADGRKFIRNITIDDLIVKMQPFGSLNDVILDKNGELINKQFASQYNVIVDIGARTLNILTVDMLKEVPDLSDNTNDGMFVAYEKVGEFIQNKFKYPIPTGKLPSVIKRGTINNIDLSPVIQKSYQILAHQIFQVLDRMFVDHWAFVNNIVFTGGGAVLLKKELTKLFANHRTMFLGQTSNVEGLRKYGMRMANKENKKSQSVIKVG